MVKKNTPGTRYALLLCMLLAVSGRSHPKSLAKAIIHHHEMNSLSVAAPALRATYNLSEQEFQNCIEHVCKELKEPEAKFGRIQKKIIMDWKECLDSKNALTFWERSCLYCGILGVPVAKYFRTLSRKKAAGKSLSKEELFYAFVFAGTVFSGVKALFHTPSRLLEKTKSLQAIDTLWDQAVLENRL